MADTAKPIILKLESADGKIVEAEKEVACGSLLLKGMLENLNIENCDDDRLKETIPTGSVEEKYLKWAIHYCEHYKNIPYVEEDPRTIQKDPMTDWDKTFMTEVPDADCPGLLESAHYLEIPGLVNIVAYRIAKYLETKSTEEMRPIFGVENDWTDEEWKEINERFAWVDKVSQ